MADISRFSTRGVVLTPEDIITWDWPEQAKGASLTTIGIHANPAQVAEFVGSEKGKAFLDSCHKFGLEIEHELHAIRELVPRSLFRKNREMFRMNERGERAADYNICVHSKDALEIAGENAVEYARILRPTTSRYFFWCDDNKPVCHCPRCASLTPSEQALILENELLAALKCEDSHATLAHLAYGNTLLPPKQVTPSEGIFLEFAPIQRRYDCPLSMQSVSGEEKYGGMEHGELLGTLDANLQVFGNENTQVLEYWLDVSRFSYWDRSHMEELTWSDEVFQEDLRTYAQRGIRHITTFAVWIDGEYVNRFGPPPLKKYGAFIAD